MRMSSEELERFKKWLEDQGGEILPPTNEYELLRFKGEKTGVIYTSGKTSGHYANNTINNFIHGAPWAGRAKKSKRIQYGKYVPAIIKRDGKNCFYCNEEVSEDDRSVDHLQPLSKSGRNMLQNMVLMHKECDEKLGNADLPTKIKLIIQKQSK